MFEPGNAGQSPRRIPTDGKSRMNQHEWAESAVQRTSIFHMPPGRIKQLLMAEALEWPVLQHETWVTPNVHSCQIRTAVDTKPAVASLSINSLQPVNRLLLIPCLRRS